MVERRGAQRGPEKAASLSVLPLLVALGWAAHGQSLRLERDQGGLRLGPLTPGTRVAALAAWYDVQGVLANLQLKTAELEVSGDAREAVWSPAPSFPDQGLYVMADVGGGRLAVLGLADNAPLPREAPVSWDTEGTSVKFAGSDMAPSTLVVALFRPGRGVWFVLSPDGSTFDRDGEENGEQVIRVSDLQPLGASGPVDGLAVGDHLVVAELRSAAVYHLMVTGR